MNHLRTILFLTVLVLSVFAYPSHAATVTLDPPTTPVSVSATELKLTVSFSSPKVTPPANVILTLIVTNVGGTTATAVAIDNLLPIEFEYTKGQPTDLADLGDLAPGETLSRSFTIAIPSTVATNRYVDEAIVSAANADSVESISAIDVTNGQVLGASTSTLAETGQDSLVTMSLGAVLMLIGFALTRKL